MLYLGVNITTAEDTLRKVDVSELYRELKSPKPEMQARIRQLRLIRSIDPRQYANLKRFLPYIVCGCFNPRVRRIENFAYTEYFIIDIDNIAEKGLSITGLREKLLTDTRIMMSFTSPGGDGLKLLFQLSERCYDAGIYSLFYRAFVRELSNRYSLQQVIDTKVCDVTRACFLSFDPDACFNPSADKVNLRAYIDTDANLSFKMSKDDSPKPEPSVHKAADSPDPDAETIRRIKELLNPKMAARQKEKPVFIPQVLNDIIDDLVAFITETGTVVDEVINIQYGKKIRMSIGLKKSEINLFYGKRGFSVVKSPRAGTSPELNELAANLIETFISGL